jgi:hypothetical protein
MSWYHTVSWVRRRMTDGDESSGAGIRVATLSRQLELWR